MSESSHQQALFSWARAAAAARPELGLLYAIPNGGARSKATAGRLKAEGVRAGVPDVCLPLPRGAHAALYIELKRPAEAGRAAGRVSPEQRRWRDTLTAAGNLVLIAYGWLEARRFIEHYLALPAPEAKA